MSERFIFSMCLIFLAKNTAFEFTQAYTAERYLF